MKFKLNFSDLPVERLLEMRQAGEEIQDSYRVLRKAKANVVGQCLAHQGTFFQNNHYPKGDVYDGDYKSQYYYHSHRAESGEHGHFHTFVRGKGIPSNIQPTPYDGDGPRPLGDDAICHLIAISMNGPGFPVGLFSTNRWVTGETFYSADDVIEMLDLFKIDHVFPCWGVNRWITAMMKLFRPQIIALLKERDRSIENWKKSHDSDVYEDRELEVTSAISIDVQKQIAAVEKSLSKLAA